MTNIRKHKKWWKSFMRRGWYDVRFCKRLETLRKFTMFRVYILRSLGSDGMYLTLTLPTKSKRKRGKNKSNGELHPGK